MLKSLSARIVLAMMLCFAGVAVAGNLPTYTDSTGQKHDSQGVGIVNPDGSQADFNNLKVNTVTGTFTDKSGTVATGGTSQTLAAANTSRKRLIVQNPCSATESLFINFTTAASTSAGSSLELVPCGSYDTAGAAPTTEQVNVTAATTSHVFIAKEM